MRIQNNMIDDNYFFIIQKYKKNIQQYFDFVIVKKLKIYRKKNKYDNNKKI